MTIRTERSETSSTRIPAHARDPSCRPSRGNGKARHALTARLSSDEALRLLRRLRLLNDPSHPALASFAEISRLAVSKTFRRREGDSIYGGPPRIDSRRRKVPRSCPSSLRGIPRDPDRTLPIAVPGEQASRDHPLDVGHGAGSVSNAETIGFPIHPRRPGRRLFGPVRPYVTSVQAFESALHATFPATLRYLASGLEPELLPDCIGPADRMSSVCA
jgi:hypothetical protein